jgi:hypothetical protein
MPICLRAARTRKAPSPGFSQSFLTSFIARRSTFPTPLGPNVSISVVGKFSAGRGRVGGTAIASERRHGTSTTRRKSDSEAEEARLGRPLDETGPRDPRTGESDRKVER